MGKMQMTVLNTGEMEKIHKETLKLLESTGLKITHKKTLELMRKAGAEVDRDLQIVRFPPELVKELLDRAPSETAVTGLNGKKLTVGGKNRYYTSLILDPFIADYKNGPRPPVLEDVRKHTIIGESLDRISSLMRMEQPVADIPGPDSYLKTMEVFLRHTTKHLSVYPSSEENCRLWMEVLSVIKEAGNCVKNAPIATIAMGVTSPLQIHGLNIEIMKMTMENNYPIVSTVCPMSGTTSPYSVAGTVLLANIEALAPVLIAQAYKPGHPVYYGTGPSVTEMSEGKDLYYKAEKMKFKIAACQMGHFYNLPVCGEAGGTLTHRADVQNGAESISYLLASLTGGQHIIGGIGSLGNANGMSAEQIIMQCGLVDMAEYSADGIDTSDYKLAAASIERNGPGGNFLTEDLTIDMLRDKTEFFSSPHFDLTGGYTGTAPGIYEKAHMTAESLVENYRPTVPEKVQNAVRDYFHPKYSNKFLTEIE